MRTIGVIGDGVTLRPQSHIEESWLHHYQRLKPADELTGYFYAGDALDSITDGDRIVQCMKAMLDARVIVIWLPTWSHEVISKRPSADVTYVYRRLVHNLMAVTAGYDDAVYVVDAPRPMTLKRRVYQPSHFWGTLRHNRQIHRAVKAEGGKIIKVNQALDHAGQLYREPNDITRTTTHGAYTVAAAIDRAINGDSLISVQLTKEEVKRRPGRELSIIGGLQPLPA